MFLHLIAADPKFIAVVVRMFEDVAPGQGRYIVVCDGTLGDVAVDAAESAVEYMPLAQAVSCVGGETWSAVLVHGLRYDLAGPLLRLVHPSTTVAWYVWGYEAYADWAPFAQGLYEPATERLLRGLAGPLPRRIASTARGRLRMPAVAKVFSRYRYVVSLFREEFAHLSCSGLVPNAQHLVGSVGSLNDYVGDMSTTVTAGGAIQVGNSANPTGNHVDVFAMLNGVPGVERVVVPLAYGDRSYAEAVIAEGRRILGTALEPIEQMMSMSEYGALLADVEHVIMAHHRQQAIGNLVAAIWRGSRVYMRDTSVSIGFRSVGIQVESLPPNGRIALSRRCTDSEVLQRRGSLESILGREAVAENTRRVLEVVSS